MVTPLWLRSWGRIRGREASLSEMALAALREHSQPGNVRELESDYR
jgi:DNA-binding NtrC family response regulator